MNKHLNQKQETNMRIYKALSYYLQKKENVSISKICRKCFISRNTFYNHFESIESLISTFRDDLLVTFINNLKEHLKTESLELDYNGNILYATYLYFKENKEFYFGYYKMFTKDFFESHISKIKDVLMENPDVEVIEKIQNNEKLVNLVLYSFLCLVMYCLEINKEFDIKNLLINEFQF